MLEAQPRMLHARIMCIKTPGTTGSFQKFNVSTNLPALPGDFIFKNKSRPNGKGDIKKKGMPEDESRFERVGRELMRKRSRANALSATEKAETRPGCTPALSPLPNETNFLPKRDTRLAWRWGW